MYFVFQPAANAHVLELSVEQENEDHWGVKG